MGWEIRPRRLDIAKGIIVVLHQVDMRHLHRHVVDGVTLCATHSPLLKRYIYLKDEQLVQKKRKKRNVNQRAGGD